jgi:hypothetical protein
LNTDPRARIWTRLEPWAALLAVCWSAFRLARGIGPDPFYNSDSAVPILLMQGLGDGPFTLYYPRQDRYGMWPFLIARAMHLATPEAMHVLAALFFCAAALPLAMLLESPAVAAAALLVPVVLNREVAWNFFQAGQPYLWQVSTLIWAWAACRLAFDAKGPGRRLAALVAFFAAGALSIWISTLSIPPLLLLVGVEAWRARARPARFAGPLLALGLSALAEGQLRRFYNAFCKQAFGERFLTVLHLDRGHLRANVLAVIGKAWATGVVVPLLLGAAVLPLPARTRTERLNQVALVLLALCPLPAYVLVHHFRENLFAGRYFSFCAFWAVAAAVSGVLVVAGHLAGERRGALRLLVLLALAVAIPASPPDPLAGERLLAARLVGPGPRLLLADYWDVYVPASLAPPGTLLPLGREGNTSRFPAMQDELRPGRTVLASCALDGADGTMTQYGAFLRRTPEPPIVAGQGGPWCLHAVERAGRPVGRAR